jgi:hypothetical protein
MRERLDICGRTHRGGRSWIVESVFLEVGEPDGTMGRRSPCRASQDTASTDQHS